MTIPANQTLHSAPARLYETASEQQASPKLYAEVAVNIPLNKVFHYGIPAHLKGCLTAGMRVKIPFGNKIITGVCVGFTDTVVPYAIKNIIGVIDKKALIDDGMLRITKWLSIHYCCGWGEAIQAILPPVVRSRMKEKWDTFVIPGNHIAGLDHTMISHMKTRSPKQAKALEILLQHPGEISAKELITISGCRMPGIRTLEKKGFVRIENKPVNAVTVSGASEPLQKHLILTQDQQNAFDIIHKRLTELYGRIQTPPLRVLTDTNFKPSKGEVLPGEKEDYQPHVIQQSSGVILLHGVTGSGKTEIYLQAIAKALEHGRKVIFLIPEISLTSQTIQRIKARFNRVAVLHSQLLGTFHHSQWNEIKEGRVDIVIGARSSIFAPLKNIGLIILDEEHENTYKQENTPRYNARDVAILRANYENALTILGTATPSLETYHNAQTGNYEKITLPSRIGERRLPPIDIVDMSEEVRKRRGYHIISQRLEYYMKQSLGKNEQVILFLNRRGFAPYVHCKRCGFVLKCRKCDIPMTFHRKLHTVICHYCYSETAPLESCPDCLAGSITYRGCGTEKIEDEIMNKFPQYKIIRMDSDSMRVRNAHEKALTAFERGEFQILLGTQMIAKGLDFPNVTLVGVISADTLLNLPDFRSSERTFQLISQVAGRTGRGAKGGRVVVQSYNPRHYSITYAASHDYEGFAKKELEYRKQLQYPPFGKLARIIFRSPEEKKSEEKSAAVAEKLKEIAKGNGNLFEILGPSPAPVTKINNMFRWHLLLKAQYYREIHHALQSVADLLRPSKKVQTAVDVDPYLML